MSENAGSTVYELTPLGQALEKPIIELGRWGAQFLPTSMEGIALPSLGAIAIAIKAFFHPEEAEHLHETYALHLEEETLQVQIREGEIKVQQGESLKSDVDLYTNMQAFLGLFIGQIQLDDAISAGLARIEGDPETMRRFLKVNELTSP